MTPVLAPVARAVRALHCRARSARRLWPLPIGEMLVTARAVVSDDLVPVPRPRRSPRRSAASSARCPRGRLAASGSSSGSAASRARSRRSSASARASCSTSCLFAPPRRLLLHLPGRAPDAHVRHPRRPEPPRERRRVLRRAAAASRSASNVLIGPNAVLVTSQPPLDRPVAADRPAGPSPRARRRSATTSGSARTPSSRRASRSRPAPSSARAPSSPSDTAPYTIVAGVPARQIGERPRPR